MDDEQNRPVSESEWARIEEQVDKEILAAQIRDYMNYADRYIRPLDETSTEL